MPEGFDSLFTEKFFTLPVRTEKQQFSLPFPIPNSPDEVDAFFQIEENMALYKQGMKALLKQLGIWSAENEIPFEPVFVETPIVGRALVDAEDAFQFIYEAQFDEVSLIPSISEKYDSYVRSATYLMAILQLLHSEQIPLAIRRQIIANTLPTLLDPVSLVSVLKSAALQLELKSPLPLCVEQVGGFIQSENYILFKMRAKELLTELGNWANSHHLKPPAIEVDVEERVDDVVVVRKRPLDSIAAYLDYFFQENFEKMILNDTFSLAYKTDVFNLYTMGISFLQTILAELQKEVVSLEMRKNIITPLISGLLCAPGAFGSLQMACLQLQSDLPFQLMSIRKELAEQVAIALIQSRELLVRIGNETHLVRRLLLNTASLLAIDVADDSFAPLDLNEACIEFADQMMATLSVDKVISMLGDKLDLAGLAERLKHDWQVLGDIEQLLNKYGIDESFDRYHLIRDNPQELRPDVDYYIYLTLFLRLHKSGYINIDGKASVHELDKDTIFLIPTHSLKFAYVITAGQRIPFIPYCLQQLLLGDERVLSVIQTPEHQVEVGEALLKAMISGLQAESIDLAVAMKLLHSKEAFCVLQLHKELLLDVITLLPEGERQSILDSPSLQLAVTKVATPRELAKLLLLFNPSQWKEKYLQHGGSVIETMMHFEEFLSCLKSRTSADLVSEFILNLIDTHLAYIQGLIKHTYDLAVFSHLPIERIKQLINEWSTDFLPSLLTSFNRLIVLLEVFSSIEKSQQAESQLRTELFKNLDSSVLSKIIVRYEDLLFILSKCAPATQLVVLNLIESTRYRAMLANANQLIELLNKFPENQRFNFIKLNFPTYFLQQLLTDFDVFKQVIDIISLEEKEKFIQYLTFRWISELIQDRLQLRSLFKVLPQSCWSIIQFFDESKLCTLIDNGDDFRGYLFSLPETDRFSYLINFPVTHLIVLIKDKNQLDQILLQVPEVKRLSFLRNLGVDYFLHSPMMCRDLVSLISTLPMNQRLEFIRDILPEETLSRVVRTHEDIVNLLNSLPAKQRLEFLRDIVDRSVFCHLNLNLAKINIILDTLAERQRLEFLLDVLNEIFRVAVSAELTSGRFSPTAWCELLKKVPIASRMTIISSIGYSLLATGIVDSVALAALVLCLLPKDHLEVAEKIIKHNKGSAFFPLAEIVKIFSPLDISFLFCRLGPEFFQSFMLNTNEFISWLNELPEACLTDFLEYFNKSHYNQYWQYASQLNSSIEGVNLARRITLVLSVIEILPQLFNSSCDLIKTLNYLPEVERIKVIDFYSQNHPSYLLRMIPDAFQLAFVLPFFPLAERKELISRLRGVNFTQSYEIKNVLILLPAVDRCAWLMNYFPAKSLTLILAASSWDLEQVTQQLSERERAVFLKHFVIHLSDVALDKFKYTPMYNELKQYREAVVSNTGMFGKSIGLIQTNAIEADATLQRRLQ